MADATSFTAETAAQHQQELNDYLQSKNLNQLFIQIVESLLIEKPDNPIGFIVEYLQKKGCLRHAKFRCGNSEGMHPPATLLPSPSTREGNPSPLPLQGPLPLRSARVKT